MIAERKIADIDAQHEQSRNRVLAAISGEDNSEAATLVRWMFENDVNPYGVFSSYANASCFETFEGIDSIMHLISHALHDDGDISFVMTKSGDAKICFLAHDEPDFEKRFLSDVSKALGKHKRVIEMARPAGFIGTGRSPKNEMDTFILIKTKHEEEYQRLIHRNMPEP